MSLGAVKLFVDPTTYDAEVEHRRYRGKYLGSEYTSAQQEAVQSGTFEDLYVGDYWQINSVNWRIADINVLRLANQVNHLVIIPDTVLLTSFYTSLTDQFKGDRSSQIYRVVMWTVKTTTEQAFGVDHIVPIRMFISNNINSTTGEATTFEDNSSIYNWPISIQELCGTSFFFLKTWKDFIINRCFNSRYSDNVQKKYKLINLIG